MTASHSRKKIYILAGILILIAAGIAAFKIGVLHFSFFRTVNAELWVMECRVRFDADNGPVKAKLLLSALGGLNAVKNADLETLSAVNGISHAEAYAVFEYFHPEAQTEDNEQKGR